MSKPTVLQPKMRVLLLVLILDEQTAVPLEGSFKDENNNIYGPYKAQGPYVRSGVGSIRSSAVDTVCLRPLNTYLAFTG